MEIETLIEQYPKVLYKYIEKKYAEDMLEKGQIKIGTLYEYRHSEHEERKDEKEGIKSAYTAVKNPIRALKNNDLPGTYRNSLQIEKGGTVELLSGSMDRIEVFVDVYVYCMSEIYDEKIMSNFGCNACVKIEDPAIFIQNLTNCMKDFTTRDAFGGQCVYIDRRQEFASRNDIPPYLIKDSSYQHQREFRVIWFPDNDRQNKPISTFTLLNTGQSGDVNKHTFWHPYLQPDKDSISTQIIECKPAVDFCSLIKD